MSTSEIDRLAQAAFTAHRNRGEDWPAIVRAVLEAMREPTKAMVTAGANAGASEPIEHSNFAIAWVAMIDEALK